MTGWRSRLLFLVSSALAVVLVGMGTTPASASVCTYDVPVIARVGALSTGSATIGMRQVAEPLEMSASRRFEEAGASTTASAYRLATNGASLPVYQAGSLTNAEARAFYLEGESQIAALNEHMIANGVPAQERALQLIQVRNALRTQTRALMADQELAALLNETNPNLTLSQLVSRAYQNKGLVGDDLWNYLAESASRSRTSVNQMFGLEP